MLKLRRKDGESLIIGSDIVLTVRCSVAVMIEIEAPDDVRIIRSEIADQYEDEEVAA